MAGCYSGLMRRRQPTLPPTLPDVWLVTDLRNDMRLEHALRRLPRGSGLVFRHYHLEPPARRARFEALARIARAYGHMVILSGTPRQGLQWSATGAYGPPSRLANGAAMMRLVTANSLRKIAQAHRARADAILLSPVHATRSHPGGKALGPVRFRLLARRALVPVIALGGMNRHRARALRWKKWAAIDGI
jgi:thiamine-phosphate pyrophosphorylase